MRSVKFIMNRLGKYELLLIILMVATLIVGIFVAVKRHDDNIAVNIQPSSYYTTILPI